MTATVTPLPFVARPFLRWAGGKTKLLPELIKRVPARMENYVEPFLGGGALFFALASERDRRFERAHLSDVNPDLVAAYVAIRDQPRKLIQLLRGYREDHDGHEARGEGRAHFDHVRAAVGDPSDLRRAARMIFLNKTCFNGLWRVNRKGLFNVPYGKRSFQFDEPEILAASRALEDVEIVCQPYQGALVGRGEGDFCYLDPPYAAISETSDFVGFAAGGFTLAHQEILADDARDVAAKGCAVLASNSDLDFTRHAWSSRGFKIDLVTAPRRIAARESSRVPVGEILASRNLS